jgi:adenine-specific DNA methylase
MKYMGSKRTMLLNGLGKLILQESTRAKRIVDLFCGAGAVVDFAAKNSRLPILAIDLQEYAVVLAKSILSRTHSLDSMEIRNRWITKVEAARQQSTLWNKAQKLSVKIDMRAVRSYVEQCRHLCEEKSEIGPIWNAYGGYYFSPEQALTFDFLLYHLPSNKEKRFVCLAALLIAAMRCIAAPGHTAQPLQPTKTAKRFVIEAWKRSPLDVCRITLREVCKKYAQVKGKAYIGNAIKEAKKLKSSDLVFVDPPYTGVQYSRFYHVLETLARGSCGPVSGRGRYPAITERPQSDFSKVGQSRIAVQKLLNNLSSVGSKVIFTFPEGECSNGLSGEIIFDMANEYFSHIDRRVIPGKFSTLGGNKRKRDSRKDSRELILVMKQQ